MTRFEDRHRALRDAADKGWRAYHGDEQVDMTEEWVPVAAQALDAFDVRTGPLVDDLVAAVRERQAVDASVVVQGYEAAEYLRLDLAVNAALAALDEASRG